MTSILKNITRLGLVSIYPLILLLCACLIWRKSIYRNTIKKHYKEIISNTLIVTLVLALMIFVFFKIEDNIYVYDYAGHWVRSLRLRDLFFSNPYAIIPTVYDSMLYQDYSSLPALFNLVSIIINTSYGFFVLSSMVAFFVPTIILFNILYFAYLNNKWYIPTIALLAFYPLYITLFFGKIDLVGIFFVLMTFALILLPKFNDIDVIDNLSFNLFGFLMIFLRRWYLYPLVGLYLVYFVKYLFKYNFKMFNKSALKDFVKIIGSGIILLLVLLVCFMPFVKNVLTNNFSEAYEVYNHSGKLKSLINFYSPIILLISIYGFYHFYKKTNSNYLLVSTLIMIIIPTAMFWHIQSFEYHHYNILNSIILFAFAYGLVEIFTKYKILNIFITIFLFAQSFIVFSPIKNVPLMTSIRREPVKIENKQEIIDFTYYLKSIMTDDSQSAYLSSSTYMLNDETIRNSILPDIDAPNIDSAVFDLRDGFPKDLEYVRYIITIDPIKYTDKEYQHIFDIITNAVWYEPIISKLYNPIYETKIGDDTLTVFERTGEWTDETKQYFYDEMIKYYPDKTDYFAYILD